MPSFVTFRRFTTCVTASESTRDHRLALMERREADLSRDGIVDRIYVLRGSSLGLLAKPEVLTQGSSYASIIGQVQNHSRLETSRFLEGKRDKSHVISVTLLI